ncbi:MAG: hydrogenase maturation peptidase HycI [Candidatus Hadarchaeaceae archaeon]
MSADLHLFLNRASRVVVVGVGSHLRGDDAVGVEIVRKLRDRIKSPNILIMEGGLAPENYTSQINRFKPTHIIIIDAADFGAEPGDVVFADPSAIGGRLVSTHNVPLSVLADYLKEQTGAEIVFLGFQPGEVGLGSKMCEAVKSSMDRVLNMLLEELRLK